MQPVALDYKLAPPHIHCTNSTEEAIYTWKCYFLSVLDSVEPDFPIHLWYRLISQAATTLNILRLPYINPQLSSEAQINGAYNFNR